MLFTLTGKAVNNERPVDNANLSTFSQKMPVAKYYRKTVDCDVDCGVNKIIKVIDCNACQVTRSANTVLNLNENNVKTNQTRYYTSNLEYLKAKCRTYGQGLTGYTRVGNSSAISLQCCDSSNNCGVYKRSNEKFGTQGAVSSGSRILRLKYNNILTSGKFNANRPRYRGDITQNVYPTQNTPVCVRRNGDKNKCA